MLDCVHFHCGPVLAGIEQQMMAISIYLGLGSSLRFTNLALKSPVYSLPDKLFCPLFSDLLLIVRSNSSLLTPASTCDLTLKRLLT